MESWSDKRNCLFELVKNVSDDHGGDDPVFLAEYCQDLIAKYGIDLWPAIECFADLAGFCLV